MYTRERIDLELQKAQFTGARELEIYWRDVEGWFDYAVSERRYMQHRQRADDEKAFTEYWERRCRVLEGVELARKDFEAATYFGARYVEFCEFMRKPVGEHAEELFLAWQARQATAARRGRHFWRMFSALRLLRGFSRD